MPMERLTAKKVRLSELTSGEWVKKEGFEPSYVLSASGEHLSRVRILGTIVSRFLADDGNFGSVTIDDTTGTIRAKTFKTVKPLDSYEIGEMVDVVGKVREYNGEIYMMPEVLGKVSDPNFLLMRRLELLKQSKASGEDKPGKKPEENGEGREKARKQVMETIEQSKEGIEFSKVIEQVDASEEAVEDILNELLEEGICYEPTPGKIKKI